MELRVLAQPGLPSEEVLEYWLWFGGLVLALLLCFVVAVYVRRRAREARRSGDGAAFDLDELREMRDTGEVTIQQYETLRQRSIAEMGLASARPAEQAGGSAEGESGSKSD